MELGRIEEAKAAFNTVISIDPNGEASRMLNDLEKCEVQCTVNLFSFTDVCRCKELLAVAQPNINEMGEV